MIKPKSRNPIISPSKTVKQTTSLDTEEALRITRNQLEVILENVGDAITAQDAGGKIIFANAQAAKLAGHRSIKALLKSPPFDYLKKYLITDEQEKPIRLDQMPGRRALAGEKDPQLLAKFTHKKTGVIYWLKIKSITIFGRDKKPYMVISTIHDITESKLAEQEKADFLNMASHELKTPLTSLWMFIQLLAKKPTAEHSKNLLEKIQDQTRRLIKLTNDLLDISRLETGKLGLNKERFELDKMVAETVDEMQQLTNKHRLILSNMKIMVRADKFRLYQVLVNLLTNAIKYSPAGEKIIISVIRSKGQAIVSVQDFGIGIDLSHHKNIFNKLIRLSDNPENTYPGLGLGLYISKEIVEKHHGKIWVESEKNKGSTFFFSIPLE